jgi:hypothetical protein
LHRAFLLKGEVGVGMLEEETRGVRAVLADEALPGPAHGCDDRAYPRSGLPAVAVMASSSAGSSSARRGRWRTNWSSMTRQFVIPQSQPLTPIASQMNLPNGMMSAQT